jgi:hypothetical protein
MDLGGVKKPLVGCPFDALDIANPNNSNYISTIN